MCDIWVTNPQTCCNTERKTNQSKFYATALKDVSSGFRGLKKRGYMIINFAIPIEYVTKYTSNETADENIREFVKGMVEDWLNEDEDCYEHYTELEDIAKDVQKYREEHEKE